MQHGITSSCRRILCCFLLGLSLVSRSTAAWQVMSHYSAVLAMEQPFYIYVPDSGGLGRTFPTLYLLHGVGGNYTNWMTASHVREQAMAAQMIIVLPDGGPYGWYLNSPMDSSSCYESYLVEELIPFVEKFFPACSDSGSRAICGLSMGGHGAVSLALKYPHLFGSASSLSGILDLTEHASMWSAWGLVQILGDPIQYPENWQAHNCYDLILQPGPKPALYFDCGLQDPFALSDNRKFSRRLDSLGIPYGYAEHAGQHKWDYWDAHLEEHLRFHQAFFNSMRVAEWTHEPQQVMVSCFPNPCRAALRISFSTRETAGIVIRVFNAMGQNVGTLLDETRPPGPGQVMWNTATDQGPAASGLYFIHCCIGSQAVVEKVTLIR